MSIVHAAASTERWTLVKCRIRLNSVKVLVTAVNFWNSWLASRSVVVDIYGLCCGTSWIPASCYAKKHKRTFLLHLFSGAKLELLPEIQCIHHAKVPCVPSCKIRSTGRRPYFVHTSLLCQRYCWQWLENGKVW